MDLLRMLLCAGLGLLLWRLELGAGRPVRDFVIWGAGAPFHFLVTAVLLLVIWGGVGAGFGLQGLFLDEDPLTQVLLGATVMLLFAAIVVHAATLGRSQAGWWTTLANVAAFLGAPDEAGAAAGVRPLQAILANGFLERLSPADLRAIRAAARRGGGGMREALSGESFRLLVAPAIVLEKGFGLILLLGVVPAVVLPLVHRDPHGCLERLPWLVGVCVGHVLGVVFATWTTAWAATAAGWEPEKRAILAALAAEPATAAAVEPPVPPRPRWLAGLEVFFLVHAVVTLGLPESITSRWIEWPEFVAPDVVAAAGPAAAATRRWNVPWLPVAVLAAEAAAAGAILVLLERVGASPAVSGAGRGNRSRWRPADWSLRLFRGFAAAAAVVVAGVGRAGRRLAAAAGGAGIAVIAAGVCLVAAAVCARPDAGPLLEGLRGYASLGAVLVCWLGIFWLATHAAVGAAARSPREQRAAVAGVAGLVALHVLSAPAWLVAPLAATAAVVSGSRTLAGLLPAARGTAATADPRPSLGRGRLVCGGLLAVLAAGTLLAARGTAAFPLVGAVWLGFAILSLGATTLARVAIRRPALLYPATVVLGYFAFAIPYTALGERWQAAMPAAGSIACIVALATACYTFVALARPVSPAVAFLAAFLGLVLLNGAAFFVAPNEFKVTFPGLAGYYRLPVYLDSRDYFRATTPTTARLRSRGVTADFDRLERQVASERLATVYFSGAAQRPLPDGRHLLSFAIEDPRGRLRARPGDAVRLAAEEWFTTRSEAGDVIALAEEPFYRRIFPLFDYDLVRLIRDGVVRGVVHPLVRGEGGAAAGRPEAVAYDIVGGTRPADAAPSGEMGLRLRGLAAEFAAVGAEYAVIALAWRGRVAAADRERGGDRYTIEFEIPAGSPPLAADELRTMQSWMERCQIDTLRPVAGRVPADPADWARAADAAAEWPGTLPGDCLVLEDNRTGSPVPVGLFLAAGPAAGGVAAVDPAFEPHRPTAANIARTVRETPRPAPPQAAGAVGDAFTLRTPHDRGLFAVAGGAHDESSPFVATVYNAGRLRPGDRVILCWNGRGAAATGAGLAHGAVCELLELEPAGERPDDGGAAQAGAAGGTGGTGGVGVAALPPGGRRGVFAAIDGVGAGGGDVSAGGNAAASPAGGGSGGPLVGQWQLVGPLDNTEVLLAWRGLVGGRWRDGKPKLVIVTSSGGGIRASIWTAVVLRKLEAVLGADFPYHVRLVTGASGGMVGAACYAGSLRPPTPAILRGAPTDFAAVHGASIEEFVDRLATNQLDAVAGRLAFADLPGAVSPFPRRGDRGRTLEETWIRCTGGAASPLARPLQAFAADERLGWRPSLVFTPMMVEDGRRLLVGNIDLAFATRNVGGLLLEPSSRTIDRATIQEGDFDLSIHEEDEVFSLSAVELFRLFPRAHDFRVATAARMSASFPWVSPAVNLPTLPPRRVVDAGYYDNYGVNLSALWLSKWADWLQENTSGVLVVQIRDRVSQGARTELGVGRGAADDSLLDRLVWHGGHELLLPGLQAVVTPLSGVSTARNWTMAFRNDEQVDLQDLLFDARVGRDFFRTVVFECPVEVSLTWRLTEREKEILAGGFGSPRATPQAELAGVKDYMTGRDSYELHKWRIEHRGDSGYERKLKARYDEELDRLGIPAAERLSPRESRELYENVVRNLKRLELLADWWRRGRLEPEPPPPE
jgi:hypothetical protein